jgi:2-C-methyl-D-erythritol 4-phosphate cytidylyltransferase
LINSTGLSAALTETIFSACRTPQIFERTLLEKAIKQFFDAGLEVTDEISAVEHIGGRVNLLPNESPNFKITYPADLHLAEFLICQRTSL